MKNFKNTFIGLLIAILIWLILFFTDLDFFEFLRTAILNLEPFEFDEFLVAFLIFAVFLHVDFFKRARRTKLEAERTKIYKAMLHANHHILNNFLNEMQIFKLTADQTVGFPDEVLELYNDIIKTAKGQIDDLSKINKVDENAINEAIFHTTKPHAA